MRLEIFLKTMIMILMWIKDSDRDGSGSVDFQEFVELMIKREAEKETPEDLKQAFRVFDKVLIFSLNLEFTKIISGWQWLCVYFWDKVCLIKVGKKLRNHFWDRLRNTSHVIRSLNPRAGCQKKSVVLYFSNILIPL